MFMQRMLLAALLVLASITLARAQSLNAIMVDTCKRGKHSYHDYNHCKRDGHGRRCQLMGLSAVSPIQLSKAR